MKEFAYTITAKTGVHARPAVNLVKAAQQFTSDITVTKAEKSADAKQLFKLIALNIKQGETVSVEIRGEDEEAAFIAMQSFFASEL